MASGRFVCQHRQEAIAFERQIRFASTGRRLSLLTYLGWAGAVPKPHAGNNDGDTAIELLSEVVTWLVLVWFGRPSDNVQRNHLFNHLILQKNDTQD